MSIDKAKAARHVMGVARSCPLSDLSSLSTPLVARRREPARTTSTGSPPLILITLCDVTLLPSAQRAHASRPAGREAPEDIRAKLKRLVNRGILTEAEPGLFTLAPTAPTTPETDAN